MPQNKQGTRVIKEKVLRRIFLRVFLGIVLTFFLIFLVINVLTKSIRESREENLQNTADEFYSELKSFSNAMDNLIIQLYTENSVLEDLQMLLNLDTLDYYNYKIETYMDGNLLRYLGITNFIDRTFKLNSNLEGVLFYNKELNQSVLFHRNLNKMWIKNKQDFLPENASIEYITETFLSDKQSTLMVSFNKPLHEEHGLSYVADAYFIYDIDEVFHNAKENAIINNGVISLYEEERLLAGTNTKKQQNLFLIANRDVNNYTIKMTQKYQSIFSEFGTLYVSYAIVTLIAMILSTTYLFKRIHVVECRLTVLFDKMDAIKNGDFNVSKLDPPEYSNIKDEISIVSLGLNEMSAQLSRHIDEVYKSKLKLKDYQIQSIRAQINPHFLYDTLEAIRMRALLNNDNPVTEMLFNAAKLYRNMMKKKDVVTLKDELEFCDAYLSLFELRFEDQLFYDIIYEKKLANIEVEQFLIQPLIENFIHHGVDHERNDNFIEINCKSRGNILHVEIMNTGKTIPRDKLKAIQKQLKQNKTDMNTGILTGLFGVDYRIHQRFGSHYGISIENSKKGVNVFVTLPIRRDDIENTVS